MLKRFALGLCAALLAASAAAQTSNPYYPFLAPKTVVGNPNTTAGPSQAIAISTLQSPPVNAVATSYTIATGDCGGIVDFTGGANTATLPAPGTFPATCKITVVNGSAAFAKTLSGFPTGSPNALGPAQAIDVAIVNGAWALVGERAPNVPQPHPASGNLLCPSGYGGAAGGANHVLTFSDQTQCFTNDAMNRWSFDPSALLTATLSGTPNNGDVEQLTFNFGGNAYTAQYTAQASDTAAKVASCLIDATASGCAGNGNAGIVQGGTTRATALYNNVLGSQGQILFATPVGAQIAMDFNSAVSMYMGFASTGNRMTVVYTNVGGSGLNPCTAGTPCKIGLDNDPVDQFIRLVPNGLGGVVIPAVGSSIYSEYFVASQSTDVTGASAIYSQIAVFAQNSTAGSLEGRLWLSAVNANGPNVLLIDNGVCTYAYACEGIDTIDTGQLWVHGSEFLALSGTTFTIASGASHNIQLAPAAGIASVAAVGSATFSIQGTTGSVILSFQNNGGVPWQEYVPSASGTDLRFFDGTADRVIFAQGGGVKITGLSTAGFVTNTAAGLLGTSPLGTGVATALGNATNSAGGFTTSPVAVANGGTGGTAASGTLLDNITGFASTGLINRTGAGAYSFVSPGTGVTAALAIAANGAGGFVTSPVANANLANAATTVAGQTCTLGSTCGLSSLVNSLGAPVNLTNTGYTDGPSVAQGSTGTWLATGQVAVTGTASDDIICQIWDGTTTIAAGSVTMTGTGNVSLHLSGVKASPAGNLRISCENATANRGTMATTNGVTASASTISAVRIN